jgi:nicotinate-nucleotide adenylyltransferase
VSRPARRLRIGVFGGTFDPPHLGHLALAEAASDELGLERVLFVPAADPPHKRARTKSAFAHRLAMTRLAVRGNARFSVSDVESRRDGPSYTVETLRRLERRHPDSELWLLLGEDSLHDLPAWKSPDEIARLARIAVAPRIESAAGTTSRRRPARRSAASRSSRAPVWLESPVLEISSSDLRARARRGESIRYLVPDAVAAYLERHRLYRAPGGTRL